MDWSVKSFQQGASPLVSCIMPTYGRPDFVGEAIGMFLAQDYPRKELILLNDCAGQVFEYSHPEVVVINEGQRYATLGEKRNAAISRSCGEILAVWDDDDIYLPWRISFSVAEMQRLATEFYRPAEFWAYWGEEPLHHNRSVPGWVSHGCTMFTRALWDRVGGYPAQNLNEDGMFFDRIHRALAQTFITYPLRQEDRFFVLRGKSQYAHMSIQGGANPLDLTPGQYQFAPRPIADIALREHVDQLIEARRTIYSRETVSSPWLSVCIALKNRSRLTADSQTLELFPHCVRSLAQVAEELAERGTIELVVADFQSNDWPLDQWLADAARPLQLKVISLDARFSRGRGLNAAVAAATSERIFLCDADMLVQPQALLRAVEIIDAGKAWFPTYECLDRQGLPEFWQDFSYGMAALYRDLFHRAGPIPEFESWGGEDNLFHESLAQHVPIIRERSPDLQHQWHPEASRHEHYANPRKSDYYLHVNRGAANSSPDITPAHRFQARHPHWEGEIHFFADGRMARPGIDYGSYEMTPERIVLHWDRWEAETVFWDSSLQAYHDPVKNFTLRKIEASETPTSSV